MLSRLYGYFVMTKPRAMLVVLVTAAGGYLLAAARSTEMMRMVHLLIGTALSGAGSIVLNQFLERDHDRLMDRTRRRPLPSGLISPRSALVYGVALSVGGTAWLAVYVNALTAVLAALCVASYVLVYTPMKRWSTLNTVVGAIPGAIPPMMGWTAHSAALDAGAWVLFLILFIWQFPHFLAIGWLYREDYARAGYTMLSGIDHDGLISARQAVLNAACLIVVSLLPVTLRFAGPGYAVGAVLAGLGLLAVSVAFLRSRTNASALALLKGTVVHISILMALLVADRMA